MKLNVPLIRQDKNSFDCGLACLSMILKYYGEDINISELKKVIKIYTGVGSYVPQLGEYLLKKGFEVEIVTMNPFIFTEKSKEKNQEELISYFQELYDKTDKDKFKVPAKFFKEFIERGGKVKIKIPEVSDIREEITAGRPVGSLLTSNFLLGKSPKFNFHFNIITGIDKEFIYVNDPMEDYRGGKHKYKIEEFMYAIYASAYGDIDNAALLKVKKVLKAEKN
ncbi:MAG: C39 family peptidase [Nanoarchaeota archaeon]|nr:C39 family peptidase [Nanoarchaeota archaeon]